MFKQHPVLKAELKKISIILLLSALCLLFVPLLEKVLTHTLVKHVLSYCQSTEINDIVIILLATGLLAWSIVKFIKFHVIDPSTAFLWIVLITSYLYYRSAEAPWIFTSFTFSEIKYLDIIFIPAATDILLAIIIVIRKRSDFTYEGFIEDVSIQSSFDDLFGYTEYCEEIATRINNSTFKRAFAIGITGDWGTGKTSFMNMIEEQLSHRNQISFTFNAWSSQSEQGITANFFHAFREQLSPYHGRLPALIENYSRSLVDATSNSFLKSLPISRQQSLEAQYMEINTMLKRINKQIIVIVDDLDRLYESELHEVIKLIRNTANFHNTVFIVGYDRNYLVRALEKINSHRPEIFLEKIFQLEITLPHYDRSVIRDRVLTCLESELSESELAEIKKILHGVMFAKHTLIDQLLVTLRDVTRFTNSFLLNYKLLRNEVVLEELFHLELLRYKYPSVYDLLHQQQGQFFESKQENLSDYKLKLTTHKGETKLKTFLGENRKQLSVADGDLDKVYKLIETLFPMQFTPGHDDRHLSITLPENFAKYFAIRLLSQHLSEKEFNKFRKKDQQEFNSYITQKVNDGYGWGLKHRLENVKKFNSQEDFEKVIRGIFHLITHETEHWSGHSKAINYSGHALSNQLYNADGRVSKKFYHGDTELLRQFIMSCFEKAASPFDAESNLLHELSEYNYEYAGHLTMQDYENLTFGYLKKFTDAETKFSLHVWWLYNNCWLKRFSRQGNEITGVQKVIAQANEAFIDFVGTKDLKGFLDTTLDYDVWKTNLTGVIPKVIEPFETWENFETFLNKTTLEATPALVEFRDFFQKFKQNNFVRVEYQFKHFANRGGSGEAE